MIGVLDREARALLIHPGNIPGTADPSYTLVGCLTKIPLTIFQISSLTRKAARALYMYQAAIPEELGFSKGDYLAVLRHQDDGWWEAEVHGGNGRIGLVPSNYLQPC